MTKFTKYLFGFCFIVLTNIAIAATPAQNLTQQLNLLQSFQGNFTQKLYDSRGKLLQVATGSFYLEKPNRFRWEITSPNHQLFVADGKNLWFYDRGLKQVTVQDIKRAIGNTPAALLSGDTGSLTRRYKITYTHGWYELNSRASNNIFPVVRLKFNQGTLSQMQMRDNLGQISTIYFSNTKLNPQIPSAIFHFSPPAKADVIGKPAG